MIDAPDGKRDFFVSFTRADREWAAWIAWALEEAGYSVFLQDWDFKGNFVLEMDKAHAQSRRTIAVLSPDYFASRFAAPEWAARFADDASSTRDLLIPVRVRPFETEGLLAQIIYVDLVGVGRDEGRQRLLNRVAGLRLKPGEEPFFPGAPLPAAARSVPSEPSFPGPQGAGDIKYIFISYSHEDGDFADLLRERLEKEGFNVWTDEGKLITGEDWRDGIDQAIRNSSVLVLIMSPNAKKSEYVTYEWSFAWGAGIRIIPILLKKFPLHPRIESLQYLDFIVRYARPWDTLFKLLRK
jgi:hypothetical protein